MRRRGPAAPTEAAAAVPNSITVGYEGLQQAANQLRSGKHELTTILRDLQAVINGLTSSGFKTRVASGRFGQHYRQWDQSTTQLVGSLDDISRAIQDAQQKHEQADQTLAAGVGAIGATGAAAGAARAASGRRAGGGGGGGGSGPPGRGGGGGTGPPGRGGSGSGGGRGGQEPDPNSRGVDPSLRWARMEQIERDPTLGWGPPHGRGGAQYASDHVRLPNGDRYTRMQGMQVTVNKDMLRPGARESSPPPALKTVLRGYDDKNLQLGHLWADRLGGPNGPQNFVPVYSHVNGGAMAFMEGQVARAVQQQGSVRLVALPHYAGTGPIPESILYAWKGPQDGVWTVVRIINSPRAT
jgi:WXG100 family type VII secretion target